MSTIKYLVLLFVVTMTTAVTVRAADVNSGPGFEISVGGGYLDPDNDRNLDGGVIGTVGLGYRFGTHWGTEFTYGRSSPDGSGNASDADVNHYRLDLVYNFLNGRWQPYVSAGAAVTDYHYNRSNDNGDYQGSVGAGLKFFMTPSLFLRGDARALPGEGSRTDAVYTFSVGYLFGQPAATVPAVVDSDGDGVPDREDRCPGTPSGAPVDKHGCALDSDGDGVPDYLDECPDTKPGARVDDHGCYLILEKQVSFRLHIRFPFNSAAIPDSYRAEVAKLAAFLKEYPQTNATVEGHTDSAGQAAYNQKLSQRRAQAVVDMLVDDFGINRRRLAAVGYGESRPIADNGTEQGRAQNRRVVAVIRTTVKERQ